MLDKEMDEARMQVLFDQLGRAKKQLAVLMKYVELSGWAGSDSLLKEVSKKELLEKSDASLAVFN